MVNTIVELHSIILMQLLIISSLKSVSWYVSYREASIVIRIVSWGERIAAAVGTSLCWMGSLRKFKLYNCFMSWLLLFEKVNIKILKINVNWTNCLWELKLMTTEINSYMHYWFLTISHQSCFLLYKCRMFPSWFSDSCWHTCIMKFG